MDIYSAVLSIWREETSTQGLAAIPEELRSSLRAHAAELRRQIRLSADRRSINTQLKEEELRVLTALVEQILSARMEKIVEAALRGEMPDNMLEFEGQLFRRMSGAARQYREAIQEASLSLDLSIQLRRERGLPVILFEKESPALVDSQGLKRGPFREGDLSLLPEETVDLLEKGGYVRRV